LIYFVRASDGVGSIKIGTTIHLSQRIKQLEKECGQTLSVLGVLPGSYAEERALHEKFDHLRTDGEWFTWSPGLLEFIERECSLWDGVDEVPSTTTLIRVSDDFAEAIKLVSTFERVSIAEFASVHLLTLVDERYRESVIREAKRLEGFA
jgi:hypothetical protein